MCVININLDTTTPAGSSINSAQGRYRKNGTTTWINFEITNLSNPQTPDIPDLGQYELQVKVGNTNNQFSLWSPSSTFEVNTTCGEIECKTYRSGPYDDRINITYIDCSGVQRTVGSTCNSIICNNYEICARSIISSSEPMTVVGDCSSTPTTATATVTYYYVRARECFDGALLQNGLIGDIILRSTTNITNWSNILVPKFPGDTEAVLDIYTSATAQDYENNVAYFASIDLDTKTGVTQKTDCTYTPNAPTTSATFSNGITVSQGHALPSADPDTNEITGTLTITGSKTYNVSIVNRFNYGNFASAILTIRRTNGTVVGTVTAQTNGTGSTITSTGGITVSTGNYTYTLGVLLDIQGSSTSGAATATIV